MRKVACCPILLTVVIFLAGAHLAAAAPRSHPRYVATDLGTLQAPYNNYTVAYGLNDKGEVVGAGYSSSMASHAFLYSGGVIQDLGTLPGYDASSIAYGINAAGQVVGSSSAANGSTHAFLWSSGGGMQDLGTLGGLNSVANAINDHGQVVGWSHPPPTGNPPAYSSHAFLWSSGGGMQDLGTLPGGTSSFANGINNAGQVVGSSGVFDGTVNTVHGFIYSGGGLQDLPTLTGKDSSSAYAINDRGDVVGQSDTEVPYVFHAVCWKGGSLQDLDTITNPCSSARAINNILNRQVVGVVSSTSLANHYAFLCNFVSIYRLDALVTNLSSSAYPEWANGINNQGQIIAYAHNQRSYLLTPIVGSPSIIDLLLEE